MTKKNDEVSVHFADVIEDDERGRDIAEAQPIPGSSAEHHHGVKERTLSFISRKYDIDGDGQLDDAELAMRDLDKSGRGFLTNEEVYALMVKQLAMQSKVFQFKKIIIGLSAFIFVLALSNLATSFASAILAKDTASEGGLLIDKETREAVATSQALTMYAIGEGGSENERRLRKLQAGETNGPGTFFTTVPVADALAMLLKCYKGAEIVQVNYEESSGQVATRVICDPGRCATTRTSSFTMERDGVSCSDLNDNDTTCVPVAGELCTESDAKISFKPSESGADFYTITLLAEPDNGGEVIPAYSGGDVVVLPTPPLVE